MVILRMTGCKETINLLSHTGFGSSYTNVQKQRNLVMIKEMTQVLRSYDP